MGTTQENSLKAKQDKASLDWETRWKRSRDHSIAEKQTLLTMVRTGQDYLRLNQLKLEQDLEELVNEKMPTVVVPDLGAPLQEPVRAPEGGPAKGE